MLYNITYIVIFVFNKVQDSFHPKLIFLTRNLRPARIECQATDMQDCALIFIFIIIDNCVFNIPEFIQKRLKILVMKYTFSWKILISYYLLMTIYGFGIDKIYVLMKK